MNDQAPLFWSGAFFMRHPFPFFERSTSEGTSSPLSFF
ncbi:hypothetical protein AtDm6_3551 [Acetobacter tropicalis]|uniref:Uncharacterized protein n=1 Tax=Acetobacter tropicalis TaxID=104102 RepID=A0A094YHI9_9PROT|nr:hypothetical protein AtDm6_3551 [Acetobacter tropicalis]